jgi:hypothetical protein
MYSTQSLQRPAGPNVLDVYDSGSGGEVEAGLYFQDNYEVASNSQVLFLSLILICILVLIVWLGLKLT